MKTLILKLGALISVTAVLGCGVKEKVTVPEGTTLKLTLETPLSTATNYPGDEFELQSIESIVLEDEVVIPFGTTFRGTVTSVEMPSSGASSPSLALRIDAVVISENETYPIYTAPLTIVGKSDKNADIERIAGTTIGGAIIGGIAEGGKGAIVGAIAGAGVGGTWAVLTKGDQVVLEPGQEFQIKTIASSELPAFAQIQ